MSFSSLRQGMTMHVSGYLVADPEPGFTPKGRAFTTIKLIHDYSYKDSNGVEVKRAIAATYTAWGNLAELMNQYLVKGQAVELLVRLPFKNAYTDRNGKQWGSPDAWIDKNSNEARSKWEFEVIDCAFGRKPPNSQSYNQDDQSTNSPPPADDPPF